MIRMRNDRILVERIADAATTEGGIIIPTRELPQLAIIIAIGWKNPEGLRPGDLVLLPKFGGLRYDHNDCNQLQPSNPKTYYLFHIKELIAVIYD
jgi:co-chaperonin GroES (HSP10)